MNQQYSNELKGVLFKNDRKRDGRKDPDYQGSCEINGVAYWISSWISESKKDRSKFMALRFNPKQASEVKGGAKNPPDRTPTEFEDSEIPF